jgi:XisI protein
MSDVNKYRQIVQNLLKEIHSYGAASIVSSIEEQVVFDNARDHYILIDVGWDQKQHVYGSIIHIDIKDGKIWIQRNNTEIDLADRLIEMGVSKENIVIGFQSPFMRQFSGYAVN